MAKKRIDYVSALGFGSSPQEDFAPATYAYPYPKSSGDVPGANQRKDYVSALGFGAPATKIDDPLKDLSRQASNYAYRLETQGIDPNPPKPRHSLVEGIFRTLNLPGAGVRSLLHESTDKEQGINWGRAFSRDRLWDNQVGGQDLLQNMGLKPLDANARFAQKAGRFAAGVGVELATDPFSWLTGGVTRPLQLLRAPVVGKPVATLAKQGAIEPLVRGVAAGFRGPSAAKTAQAARALLQGAPNAEALAKVADFVPTGAQEKLGYEWGQKLRPVRGLFPNAATDPEALALFRERNAVSSVQQGRALDRFRNLADPMGTDERKLVTDLLEDPAVFKEAYGIDIPLKKGESVDQALQRLKDTPDGQTLLWYEQHRRAQLRTVTQKYGVNPEQAVPELSDIAFKKSISPNANDWQEADSIYRAIHPEYNAHATAIEEWHHGRGVVIPEPIEKAFRQSMALGGSAADRETRRGILGAIRMNYFPHMFGPDDPKRVIGGTGLSASVKSALQRKGADTVRAAHEQGVPFVHEFQYPMAKRIYDDIRAVNNHDLAESLVTQFGVKVEDVAKKLGVKVSRVTDDALGPAFVKWHAPGKLSVLGDHFIPENVKYAMDRLSKAYETDEGVQAFMKVWDSATNIWKPLVTVFNPTFHVNNFLGNLWNMFLGGMDDPTRLKDGLLTFYARPGGLRIGSHVLPYAKLNELGLNTGVFDSGFLRGEMADELRSLSGVMQEKAGLSNLVKRGWDWAREKGMQGGEFIEGTSRATLFADQMAKRIGALPEGAELTDDLLRRFAHESTDHVNTYLFDYRSGLSTFENNVMRRLMPFWAFTRFNVPLQVAELVNQPGKFLLYDKAHDNLVFLNPVSDEAPPWYREGMPVGKGDNGGQTIWNPRLPLHDLNKLNPREAGETFSMFSPLVKVPIELKTNHNLFTGREISKYPGQTLETVGGMRVPVELDHVWKSASGVFYKGGQARTGLYPDASTADRLKVFRLFFPGVFTYNPERTRVGAAYSEVERLENLLRKYEDESGRQVPTITEMRKAQRGGEGLTRALGF